MFGVCNIYDILEIGVLNRFSKKATNFETSNQVGDCFKICGLLRKPELHLGIVVILPENADATRKIQIFAFRS